METNKLTPARLSALRIRQLQLLLLIGELGSISKAAVRASISQQAATEMLKDLEGAFGAQLFVRNARGALLTPAGEKVSRHAAAALRELNLAHAGAQLQIPGSVRLRIGFSHGILHTGLTAAVASFHARHQEIELTLNESTVLGCVVGLMQGTLDVAVTVNHPNMMVPGSQEPLTVLPLDDQYYYTAFASRSLAERLGPAPTLEQLLDLTWFYPGKESLVRHLFDDWFIQRGAYPPARPIQINPTLRAVEFMRHVDAIAMLPSAMRGRFEHVVDLPVEALKIPLRRVFACSEAALQKPEVQALLRCIRKADAEVSC